MGVSVSAVTVGPPGVGDNSPDNATVNPDLYIKVKR
jgi:hypothetical protein